jgi:uncharacterized membrane protein
MEGKENPLARFSLTGEGNRLADAAQQQVPLLGNVVLFGQTTVWYGAPNTGKTLLALSLLLNAIGAGRIDGQSVFYVNADDSASGMATKATILDDLSVHTLAPGYKGFTLGKLAPAMAQMAETDQAKGSLIIIDTLKKVADLMSKKECADFGKVARTFSMKGGSLLGLAHTNKNRSASGKLIYAGTSDILEDFDCAYLLEERKTESNLRYIGFEALKRRGDNAETACFEYSTELGLSYEQRLLTVTEIDPDYGSAEIQQKLDEAEIIEVIKKAIQHGTTKKMAIAELAGRASRSSRRAVLDTLEKYTGPDPKEHLWDYERREHGAHIFRLHDEKSEESPAL